jgi:hypothetical protein
MSQRLISRSADLKRLRDEGFEVTVVSGYLVVGHVPYVNSERHVQYGSLIAQLNLSGDTTAVPNTHVVHFSGEQPCDATGAPLSQLIIEGHAPVTISADLTAGYTFSQKPIGAPGYPDYYAQMTTYAAILTTQAQALQADVNPRTFAPVVDEDDAIFEYIDTSSSRSGIAAAVAAKLAINRVAIVGAGGTGAYLLDFLVKVPIAEIHLFDHDTFLQHNAFRSPGAASLADLQRRFTKVEYLAERYRPMRRGIIAHPTAIDESNAGQLGDMDFVFLCIDDAQAKKVIIDRCEQRHIPFIDVGMGLYEVDGAIAGVVRTTVSTDNPASRAAARARISLGPTIDDAYEHGIQIAELNALNAAFATIAFKRFFGFYPDLKPAHSSAYAIDTNDVINDLVDDEPEPGAGV